MLAFERGYNICPQGSACGKSFHSSYHLLVCDMGKQFLRFQSYLLGFLAEHSGNVRVRGEEAGVKQSGLSARYFITFAIGRLSQCSLCQGKFWL